MIQSKFFNRKKYLEILDKRITGLKEGYRQNLAIIGDELIGKTSLIFQFLKKFCDNRILTFYLEIRPEPLESFVKRFIGILLYNFLINSGIELKENIDFLIAESEKYIPETIEKIKDILSSLKKKRKRHLFIELLSLTETINKETGKFCVVIMDEFHNLENIGFTNLYPEWSKLLILQKNTMYIIISSLKSKAKTILSKNLSLLFGNFELITVEPFDIKSSEAFLEYFLSEENIKPELKDFITHFTGGSPFYLELITRELLKSSNANLTDLLEELLFLPSGILNQKFSGYLKRFLYTPHSQDYTTILYLIAGGHNRIKDIAHILHRQRKDILSRMGLLLELDTITRSGDFFKINDRVFGFWLRFVYQEKLQSLTFDAKNQKTIFREKIEDTINEFIISAKKPITERAIELLRLFEDDVMQLEKRKLRLSHFREIKSVEFNNKRLWEGLLGRSTDNLWIIGFKHDLLTEEDVSEFVKECKRYRHKQQKKIIVALRETDTNARLKALEEKILMWNIENLNQLFDLYTKPRIIIQ